MGARHDGISVIHKHGFVICDRFRHILHVSVFCNSRLEVQMGKDQGIFLSQLWFVFLQTITSPLAFAQSCGMPSLLLACTIPLSSLCDEKKKQPPPNHLLCRKEHSSINCHFKSLS